MNEQTKPIDVLAVMMVAAEVAASNGLHYTHDGLKDARAAIAELIEACEARDLAVSLSLKAELEYGPLSPQAQTAARVETDARLRYYAALAKVGGA